MADNSLIFCIILEKKSLPGNPRCLQGRDGENKLLLESLVQRLRAGLHVQLVVDVVDMLFNGINGDEERCGDLFVKVPFGKKIKYFQFAVGERSGGSGRFVLLVHGIDRPPGNLAAHGRAAVMQVTDGFQDLGGRGVFQDIPVGPGPEGVEDVAVIIVDRVHQEL